MKVVSSQGGRGVRRPRFESLESRCLLTAELDLSFGDGAGFVTTEFFHNQTPTESGEDHVVDAQGRAIVVGPGSRILGYKTDGSLDPDFGEDGVARFPAFASSIAHQDDGKLVVAGTQVAIDRFQTLLARYNADGSLDTTFGEDGIAIPNIGPYGVLAPRLAVTPNGKIVVAATRGYGPIGGVLMRLEEDGRLDLDFGVRNMPTTKFVNDIDVGENGTIFVAGYDWGLGNPAVVRQFRSDGTEGFETVFDLEGSNEGFLGVAVQQDGKVLATGAKRVNGSPHGLVVRLQPDGTLDASFGTAGEVALDFGDLSRANAITILPNGQYIVTGAARDMEVVRLNHDGTMDASFGSDGRRTIVVGPSSSGGRSVVTTPQGKLSIVGHARVELTDAWRTDVAIAQLTADGDLDVSFDSDGVTSHSIGESDESGRAVALTSQGDIVVAGHVLNQQQEIALVRYHADGRLDPTFGEQGRVSTSFTDRAEANSVIVQADDKIVIASEVRYGGVHGRREFGLSRYNVDGTLDLEFGGDGMVETSFGTDVSPSEALLQPDGRIVVVGGARNRWYIALARYHPDGSLDRSFGSQGKLTTRLGDEDAQAQGAILQSNGKIVVVGSVGSGTNQDLILLRYNSDGSLDHSFGTDGLVITDLERYWDAGIAVTTGADGKLLVVGRYSFGDSGTWVSRYDPDGGLDTTFGTQGKLKISLDQGRFFGNRIAVEQDGKLLIGGRFDNGVNNDFAVARLHHNGSLDTSFANGGLSILPIGQGEETAPGMVVDQRGDVLLAGSSDTGSSTDFALARFRTGPRQDFGDAPSTYPTSLVENGARHDPTGPRLGSQRDFEPDASTSEAANGDDLTGIDDEDGVLFGTLAVGQSVAGVNIDLQNSANAYVDAWIDFDRDGEWQPDEKILDRALVSEVNGSQTLNYSVASDAVAGVTFARVRVSSAGGLDVGGRADDGEVEDYAIDILPLPQIDSVAINSGSSQRSTVSELTITFNRHVIAPASAFTIKHRESGILLDSLVVNSSINPDGNTVSRLTFASVGNLIVDRELGNSLIDGNYELVILGSKIVAAGGPAMDSNYVFGDSSSDGFFRYFGDSDGDRDTDGQEYGRFGRTFFKSAGQPLFDPNFDFDGDGDVDGKDFGRFRSRFMTSLAF